MREGGRAWPNAQDLSSVAEDILSLSGFVGSNPSPRIYSPGFEHGSHERSAVGPKNGTFLRTNPSPRIYSPGFEHGSHERSAVGSQKWNIFEDKSPPSHLFSRI